MNTSRRVVRAVDVPRRFRRISTRACQHDHEHFRKFPAPPWYVRTYCPGELWPSQPHPVPTWCLVIFAVTGIFRICLPGPAGETLERAERRAKPIAEKFLAGLARGAFNVPESDQRVIVHGHTRDWAK